MKYNLQARKTVKLIVILVIIWIYYILNSPISNPYSIYLMFPIGFIFSYKERTSSIYMIDRVILIILIILMVCVIYPPLDFLGLFTYYIHSSARILGLLIFLFGYYVSYFLTTNDYMIMCENNKK